MQKSTKEYPLKMKITFLLEKGEGVTDLGTLTYKAGEIEEEYSGNVLPTFREDLRGVFGEEEEVQ